MSMITLAVSIAAAIAVGTCGAYILMMKLMTSQRGKQAMIDYGKQLSDLTYELVKANLADTKRWQELISSAESAFEEE